jgi:hypothetical protein
MWSDTFLLLERGHLLRLIVWGGASVLLGTMMLLVAARAAPRPPFLHHFGLQTAAWGTIDLVLGLLSFRNLAPRDLQDAAQLDRFLWLNLGLDAGYVGVGATLAIAAWVLGRRWGGVGAGVAIVIQGLALLVLDARFLFIIDRFV